MDVEMQDGTTADVSDAVMDGTEADGTGANANGMAVDAPANADGMVVDANATGAVANTPEDATENSSSGPTFTYIVTMQSLFPATNDTQTTQVHLAPMAVELAKLPIACLQLVTPEEACVIPFNAQNRIPTRMNTVTLLSRLAFVIANRCDAAHASLGNVIRQRVVESLTATYDTFMFTNRSRRDVELKLYSSQITVNGVRSFHRTPLIESRIAMTKYVVCLMLNAVSTLYLNGAPIRPVTYINPPTFASDNPFQAIEQENMNQVIANRSTLLGGQISALPAPLTDRCFAGEPVTWSDATYSYMLAVYRMLGKQ